MFGIIIWNSKLLLVEMGLLIFKTLIKVTHSPPETVKSASALQVCGWNCIALTRL